MVHNKVNFLMTFYQFRKNIFSSYTLQFYTFILLFFSGDSAYYFAQSLYSTGKQQTICSGTDQLWYAGKVWTCKQLTQPMLLLMPRWTSSHCSHTWPHGPTVIGRIQQRTFSRRLKQRM